MDIMLERILLSIPKRYGAKKCKNGHEFGHKNIPHQHLTDGGCFISYHRRLAY